ncbi:MAG: hypothetical protein OXJ52_05995 [Oligoflexia bacterium]|nr:hypothetical protein [Oligoflexia bacterium]
MFLIIFTSYILAQKFYGTDAYYSIRNIFLDKEEICWNEINFKRIEKQLITLKVKEKRPLFKNQKLHVFLIVFENGLKAVFKVNKTLVHQIASLRAYHLSQLLNWRIVPPTVIRAIEGREGILKLFIEGKRLKNIDSDRLAENQKTKVYLFHFLMGLNDPDTNNAMMGNNCGHLAVIDNDWMWFPAVNRWKDYPFATSFPFTRGFSSTLKAFLENERFPPFKETNIKSIKFTKKLPDYLGESAVFKSILSESPSVLYWVKWNGQVWMKYNIKDFKSIYIKFAPDFISKNLLKSVKQLDSLEQLNSSFLSFIAPYFDKREIDKELFRIKVFNYFTFYNRQTLLEVFDR